MLLGWNRVFIESVTTYFNNFMISNATIIWKMIFITFCNQYPIFYEKQQSDKIIMKSGCSFLNF